MQNEIALDYRKGFLTLLLLPMLLLGSCQEKECCDFPAGEAVEFQLLDHYQLKSGTNFELVAVVPSGIPFISYDEIDSYSPQNHAFTVKEEALARIRQLSEPTPYAVVVDEKVIYAGFFWPSFMSSPCDCLRIDPLAADDEIKVELGYASLRNLSHIDSRNHVLLLSTLDRDGKLD